MFCLRQFQWWDEVSAFALQVERDAAAGDDLQLRRGGKQFGDNRCGGDQLLKVIQYQQHTFVAQIILDVLKQGTSAFTNLDLLGNARDQPICIWIVSQGDEIDTIGELIKHLLRYL